MAPRPVFPPEPATSDPARARGGPSPLFVEPGGFPPGLVTALDTASAAEMDLMDADRQAFRRALGRIAADLALHAPDDLAPFDAATRAAQARVTAVPDALLLLMTERADGVAAALGEVVALVRSVAAEDLLPTGVGGLLLRRLAPPEERLRNAVAGVEVATERVRAALPAVEARHERVLLLLREEAEARRDLLLHLRAGEAVLAWRGGTTPTGAAPTDLWTGTGRRDGLAALEERVASLRLTLAASAGDTSRLDLLRDADARLLATARTGLPELVAAWKRGCSTVLLRLAARDGRALGAAVVDLLATRDRLVHAIEAATR